MTTEGIAGCGLFLFLGLLLYAFVRFVLGTEKKYNPDGDDKPGRISAFALLMVAGLFFLVLLSIGLGVPIPELIKVGTP